MTYARRLFSGVRAGLVLSLLVAMTGASSVRHVKPPNVIVIMADDVGYECFGTYGSRQYKTPHIDQLAAGGIRFNHCYAQPLCTPSRIKLMTGSSNARNYSAFSVLNRGLKTIGNHMKAAGYRTAVAGKWQLYGAEHYPVRFRAKGTLPANAGFDKYCLWQVDKLGSRFDGPLLNVDGRNIQFAKDRYGPKVATQYLLDFMAASGDHPFFAYYPMILVHSPFVPTPDTKNRNSRNRQSHFEDMVAYMDKMVGRIVQKTRDLGIAENTLIMFVGDNGTHRKISSELNGVAINGGKGATTDAGTRVPLIAYWPGTIPRGQLSDDLVDFSDFLPTVLDVANVEAPADLDGRSFLPQLKGQKGRPREWVYIYYCPRPERSKPVFFIRDQRWKLYGDGRFYDIKNDVLEKTPLSDNLPLDAEEARKKLISGLESMPRVGRSLLKFSE